MTDRTAQLDFLLALFRPFLTTEEAGFLLDDCTEQHVRDLLDEGKLRGVNIASDADGSRREIRIYRYTIEHRLIWPKRDIVPVSADQIIPHHRPTILRRELASWLGCSEQHISNLKLDGPRDNSDSRHRIHRTAVVNFLTSREL